MEYSDLQNKAIDAIVEWYGVPIRNEYDDENLLIRHNQEFYLAGYAGTGKSTIAEEAIRRIRHKYGISNVAVGAYTGKAAYILRKKGNAGASTIHGLIYTCVQDPITRELTFVRNEVGSAAMADLLLLDECSMIDKSMAEDLRSFGKKILVMGDPGQLPPINGDGIFTNRKPDFFLNEIHRQAQDSPIIELATMARNGIKPPIGYHKGNVRVMQLSNQTAELIHNPDTQVLCGLNSIRYAVTQLMRKELGFHEQIPMPGEKILCCKNNRGQGLFNGGAGTLQELKIRGDGAYEINGEIEEKFYKTLMTDPYLFHRHFDNGQSKKDWKKRCINEFDWGYIWSVHKAQGSGWPHVTLIDNSASFRDDRWKHLYTGLTRAESGLTVLV